MAGPDQNLLKSIAALEAYLEDLQKAVDRLHRYKEMTITLRSEMDQVKKEMGLLWKMHKDYQEKKVLIKVLDSKHKRLGRKVTGLVDKFDKLTTVTLKDYPDMKETYKTIKKGVITWLVVSFLAIVAISFGVNIYFSI